MISGILFKGAHYKYSILKKSEIKYIVKEGKKMRNIVVYGSFVVDLMQRAGHLPVTGETVKSSLFKMGPGGKGFNQAVAAHQAGADVQLITKLGRDDFADVALDKMEAEEMNTDYIFYSEEEPTGTALIMVDEETSDNKIMVNSGACDAFTEEDVERICPVIQDADYLLAQLEVNLDMLEKVITIAHDHDVSVVLDPAPIQELDDEFLKKINIITPNEVEASVLTNIEVIDEEDAEKAADYLLAKGIENVVITLGEEGVFVKNKEQSDFIKNFTVDVLDTAGAGDAFNGGLTALAEGKDIFEAARFACATVNLSVTKLGTSVAMPKRLEIDAFIAKNQPY